MWRKLVIEFSFSQLSMEVEKARVDDTMPPWRPVSVDPQRACAQQEKRIAETRMCFGDARALTLNSFLRTCVVSSIEFIAFLANINADSLAWCHK